MIKELGGDSKLSGRFFLKQSKKPENPTDTKFQSPLRRIPLVRLNFTTMQKNAEEKSTFSTTLSKLLLSIGIAPKDENKQPEPEKKTEGKPPDVPKAPVISAVKSAPLVQIIPKPKIPAAPQITPVKPQVTPNKPQAPAKPQVTANAPKSVSMKIAKKTNTTLIGAKFQMKMVQTEPFNCQLCEIRATRKYVNQETQCGQKTTADASTQVTDEEFKSPLKSILKNKSLAHLTPAQILAQEKGTTIEETKKSLFPIAQKEKPSPVKAPEKSPLSNPKRPDLDSGRFGRNRSFGNRFDDREFNNRDRGNFERNQLGNREGFHGNSAYDRPHTEFGRNFGNREVEIIDVDDYMEEEDDRHYPNQRFFEPPSYSKNPNNYNFRGNNRRFM